MKAGASNVMRSSMVANHRSQRTPRFRSVCILRQWRGAAAAERCLGGSFGRFGGLEGPGRAKRAILGRKPRFWPGKSM